MSNLKHRQEKIQQKRKNTPWREFVMEICSWMPLVFNKIGGKISRFPETGREGNILPVDEYIKADDITSLDVTGESFLELFQQLFIASNKMMVQQWFENENCDYAESYSGKNCYLSFAVGQNAENIMYSTNSHTNIRNVVNSFGVVGDCDIIFSSKIITGGYKVFYSTNIHNCSNIRFSTNLIGCTECIGCSNLENQSYCIQNKQYEKEEYLKIKQDVLNNKKSYQENYDKVLQVPLDNKQCENVEGNGMLLSSNIETGYYAVRINHGRNIFMGGGENASDHFYDAFDAGNQNDEHLYATHYVGETSSHAYCISGGANVTNCYYSYHLESCSFCLGCVGLTNKSYYILNKPYEKEDRHKKVNEIFTQMESEGTLGNFFLPSTNPFYFNDTAAYLIDDTFTKEEVEAAGYLRRDEEIKVDISEGVDLIGTQDLDQFEGFDDNGEWTISPDILKKVIKDERGNCYKIIQQEYDYYTKYGLPLPRNHRLSRIKCSFSS